MALKTELDIANEILAILQNVEDEEDQSVFVRIYVDAIIRSAEFTGAKLDKYQIYKKLANVTGIEYNQEY